MSMHEMSSDKCKKCCIDIERKAQLWFTTSYSRYRVCSKCWDEWHDNGYSEMCGTLYRDGSRELADKFMLDYLGMLDE